jgi:hypothetical protein
MRDPAARVDPAEADIEETCGFLKRYMPWKADPDGFASDMRAAAGEVEASNMPEWAKNVAIAALFRPANKRRGRPRSSSNRNGAIRLAAIRLVTRGYLPTRNETTCRARRIAANIAKSVTEKNALRLPADSRKAQS